MKLSHSAECDNDSTRARFTAFTKYKDSGLPATVVIVLLIITIDSSQQAVKRLPEVDIAEALDTPASCRTVSDTSGKVFFPQFYSLF